MSQLITNDVTNQLLQRFIEHPTHALLLVGPNGSGKGFIARHIAQSILKRSDLTNFPYILEISPATSNMSIEAVRSIDQFIALKVPGPGQIKRIIIIEQADELQKEAQSALLKNYEEPPTDTLIIMTATRSAALLSTITSRAQVIRIGRVSEQTIAKSHPDIAAAVIAKTYAMTGGLMGLTQSLLSDDEHPLIVAAREAKKLLTLPIYDRLLEIDELSKNRELTQNILTMMQQIARLGLLSEKRETNKRWQKILQAAYHAQSSLDSHAQPKLVLTNLMFQL